MYSANLQRLLIWCKQCFAEIYGWFPDAFDITPCLRNLGPTPGIAARRWQRSSCLNFAVCQRSRRISAPSLGTFSSDLQVNRSDMAATHRAGHPFTPKLGSVLG